MQTASIKSGDRVRVQLPNWDGPSVVVYTVAVIEGGEAILRQPKIPGMSGATVLCRTDQLVAA